MTSSSTSHSGFTSGSVSYSLSGITLPHSGTAATHGRIRWKEEEEVAAQRQAKKWDENSPPPPYLRKRGSAAEERLNVGMKNSLPPPYSIRMQVGNKCRRESKGTCRNRRDVLWTNRTHSSQTRRCQGMAHHYRAPSAGIKAHTRAGDPPLPQTGPRNDLTMEPLPRGPQRATWADRTAQT